MYAYRPQQNNIPIRRPAVHKQPKGATPKPKKQAVVPNMRPYSFAAHSASESNLGRYAQNIPAVPKLPAHPQRPQAQAHTHVKPQSNATPRPVPTKSYSLFPAAPRTRPLQAAAPTNAKIAARWDSTQDWNGKKATNPFNQAMLANNSIMTLTKELTRIQHECQRQIDSAPRARRGFFSSLFRRSKRSHSVPNVAEAKYLTIMNTAAEIKKLLKRAEDQVADVIGGRAKPESLNQADSKLLRQLEQQLLNVIYGRQRAETVNLSSDKFFEKLIRAAEMLVGQARSDLAQASLQKAGIL